MRGVVALGLLAGCAEPEPPAKEDTGPWVAPLATTYMAVAANTYTGALKSTCVMSAEVVSATDSSVIASIMLDPADGGRWAGMVLTEGVQVKATLNWSDCENTSAGEGTFPSSVFSGEPGDLFVLYYNGVGAGFEWLVQAEDHLGGEVRAQFVEGTESAAIEALAADLDATTAADPDEAGFHRLAWSDTRSVAEVLAALSSQEAFLWGEPVWVAKPGWW